MMEKQFELALFRESVAVAIAGLCFFAVSVLIGDYVALMTTMGLDGNNLLSMNIVVIVGIGFYGFIGVRSFMLFLKVHDERKRNEWINEGKE